MLVKLQHSLVGLPDRILLQRPGIAVLLEFKRKGEPPTPIQVYYLDKLRALGFYARIVSSVAEFKQLLIP